LLYVEQILRIALQLAGLNNEDAYILYREWLSPTPPRKARQRGILIQALTRQGIDPASATAISDQVDQSIGGTYPRAHAVAYTLIDYRCLWLFAHDPDSFSSAVDEIYPHFKG
jgi:DNA polymerase-3 subunit alpha